MDKKRKFILCSQSLDGYGLAVLLVKEGNEVILATQFRDDDEDSDKGEWIGSGIVEQMPLEDVFKKRKEYSDFAWWFDYNFGSEMADTLRKEGFLVKGGEELSDKLEHDRLFGISIIERAGLESPPYHEFTTNEEGMALLDENPDTAFVLKPDEPDEAAWVTTVPNNEIDEKANREIYSFLESVEAQSPYILQERKKGVEVNVEIWLYDGEAFFAHANFECKQKQNNDQGKQCGCAADIEFIIPLDARIIQDTVMRIAALKEFEHYTGPLDCNIIVGDNHYWFLEFCARDGYNSSPNLYMNLLLIPLGEMIYKWLTGDTDDFYLLFRQGFGASITLRSETKVKGLPVMIEPEAEKNIYHFSTYHDDGWTTTGYMEEVAVAMGHDYDIKSAFDEAMKTAEKVHFAGRFYRTDMNKTDFPSNPIERYGALVAMGMLKEVK